MLGEDHFYPGVQLEAWNVTEDRYFPGNFLELVTTKILPVGQL